MLRPGTHDSLRRQVLPWTALVIFTALVHWRIRLSTPVPADWHYFLQGARLLFDEPAKCSYVQARHAFRMCPPSPDGLHLFAGHPNLQIGPLALVLVRGLLVLGEPAGQAVAVGLSYVGPFWLLLRISRCWGDSVLRVRGQLVRRADLLLLSIGPVLLLTWAHLSSEYLHVDDLLVLAAVVLAVEARLRDRPWLVGAALGIGVAAKPTALGMLPIALLLPWRELLRAAVAFAVLSALAWGPFVVADPGTLSKAGSFVPSLQPGAPLSLVVGPGGDLSWVRAVQLVAVLLVGALVASRVSWLAVPAAAFAVRVLLDPGDFSYHAASVVVACALYDLYTGARWPRLSAPTYAMFYLAPTVLAWVGVSHPVSRLLACLTPLAVLAADAARGRAGVIPPAVRPASPRAAPAVPS